MTAPRIPRTGIVSHVLPPSPSGQAVVLSRLLSGIPADRYRLISREERGDGGGACLPARRFLLPPPFRFPASRFLDFPRAYAGLNAAAGIAGRALWIARIAREERLGLLVACTGDLYDLPAACLAGRWAGVPFVPYIFDDYAFQWTGADRAVSLRLTPALLRRAAAVIVPNESMREEYLGRYGVDSTVIRNPCPLPDLAALDRAERVFAPGTVDIVYAGAVYHANGDALRNLADALGRLGRPDVRLHLFTAQSGAEIARAGISGPAVVVHPHIDPGRVPAVLRQASALFLPLGFATPIPEVIRTSAPGKTGEYLSVGRPIVVHAPADTFVSRYFGGNGCGLVIDRNDPGALAAGLAALLADPDEGARLGARARACAERDFEVGAVRVRFLDFLSSVGGGGGEADGR